MSKTTTAAKAPDEWQIREDMHTLVRATEIRADPKRLAAARKAAKEEREKLQSTIKNTEAVAAEK